VASPSITLAPLGRRFGALLVDWILALLISRFFVDVRQAPWFPLIIIVVEYGFFIGLFGQTPGMWLAKVCCVRYSDHGPLGIPMALVRGIVLVLVLPALIMDEERRGYHDRLAGSIMLAGTPAAQAPPTP
jgi:uncharacterized RDD family membrane protein YckC